MMHQLASHITEKGSFQQDLYAHWWNMFCCVVVCTYPCYGHDAQSKQAGPQQVPQTVAVQLQCHGQRHSPQQIQHLDTSIDRYLPSVYVDFIIHSGLQSHVHYSRESKACIYTTTLGLL